QVVPRETDHEAQGKIFALAPNHAADAGARGHDVRERRCDGHLVAPVQAVVIKELLTGLWLLRRVPEGDDVVGRFVVRGQFDQVDRALGPATLRLDPDVGTTL